MLTTKEFGNINRLTREREEIESFLKEGAPGRGLALFVEPKIKLFKRNLVFKSELKVNEAIFSKIEDILRERVKEIETELEKVTIREEIKDE